MKTIAVPLLLFLFGAIGVHEVLCLHSSGVKGGASVSSHYTEAKPCRWRQCPVYYTFDPLACTCVRTKRKAIGGGIKGIRGTSQLNQQQIRKACDFVPCPPWQRFDYKLCACMSQLPDGDRKATVRKSFLPRPCLRECPKGYQLSADCMRCVLLRCPPIPCPKSLKQDPKTCECVKECSIQKCDFVSRFDKKSCKCVTKCQPKICPSGFSVDEDTCECTRDCKAKSCRHGYHLDPDSCECKKCVGKDCKGFKPPTEDKRSHTNQAEKEEANHDKMSYSNPAKDEEAKDSHHDNRSHTKKSHTKSSSSEKLEESAEDCSDKVCKGGYELDPDNCECYELCPGTKCTKEQILNVETCSCEVTRGHQVNAVVETSKHDNEKSCAIKSCPEGFILDEEICECVIDDVCKPGEALDVNDNCVKVCVGENCPNEIEAIRQCTAIICPIGYEVDRKTCNCKSVCNKNCPPGFTLDPISCACNQKTDVSAIKSCTTHICPKGFLLDIDSCECEPQCEMACPGGSTLDPVKCECRKDCPNGDCEKPQKDSSEVDCPEGSLLNRLTRVCHKLPVCLGKTCGGDLVLDVHNCECVPDCKTTCPTGFSMDYEFCECIKDCSEAECPDNYEINSDDCSCKYSPFFEDPERDENVKDCPAGYLLNINTHVCDPIEGNPPANTESIHEIYQSPSFAPDIKPVKTAEGPVIVIPIVVNINRA